MIPTPPHLIRTPAELDGLFPWLRHELLRGIPHFISPSWTADRSRFDPEHYADCWQRIGFKSVTLLTVHHDGYYLYPSRLCRLQPDRDYFGEQVEACRRRGIRVIAYYSLTLNSLVGSEHPEWRVRDLRGRVHQPDYRQFSHYHWMCLNSPFRDFAVAQLEELVTRYPVEGIWLDILYLPGLPGPNDEPEAATCFCDHCHRQYSAWNHGEHLVDAAHSARHLEFRAETYKNFLIQAKTMLLKQPRPLLLTFNGAGRYRMPFYERNDALADLLTGEAHSPMSLMIAGKVLRNDGRPFEMLSCSEVCWSHISPKPTTLIQLESLPPIIQGGTYTLGITHAPDGRLSPANIERLVEHSRWIHERRDVLTGTEPVYEAAIAGPYQKAENWALILRQAHVLFNILPSWKALGDYRVVVFPAETAVPADAVPLIEAYVRQGGAILVESPAARVRDGGPWTLQDLLGCTPLGEERAYGFYLDVTSRDVAQDLLAHEPVFIEFGRAACVGLTTAEPLAVLVPQFKDKVRLSDNQTVPNYPARPDQHPHWPGLVLNTLDQGP
ncbi:MAG: hypothetical protein FJ272_17330 [Planctomycetes bacterium]|nr:hypothetical protein [Planctomycetota bacterium]